LLQKGQLIYLEGKLATRKFTDNSDIVRYTTEVVAEKFTILGRKSDFAEADQLMSRQPTS
jgi:single-strand DNA-binding protein